MATIPRYIKVYDPINVNGPRIWPIETNAGLSTILEENFLYGSVQSGFKFKESDLCMIASSTDATVDFYNVSYTNENITLSLNSNAIGNISEITIEETATYTPSNGAAFFRVQAQGGGGGSGGVTGATAGQCAGAGGGGGGGCAIRFYNAIEMGATAAVTIGAGGTAGASGANNGGAGGNTVFNPAGTGTTITGEGGAGGEGMPKSASAQMVLPGLGGSATGGTLNIAGGDGGFGATQAAGVLAIGGSGGDSMLGNGGAIFTVTTEIGDDGGSGTGYGAGAAGAADIATADRAGLAGQDGVCLITEYIIRA